MPNNKRRAWSAKEDAVLALYYPGADIVNLLLHLPGRTWNAAAVRASRIGIYHGAVQPWKADEVTVLRERYAHDGPARLAPVLNRTPMSISRKGRALGLAYDCTLRERLPRVRNYRVCSAKPRVSTWTVDELTKLDAIYSTAICRDVAAAVGRTMAQVRGEAKRRGLATYVAPRTQKEALRAPRVKKEKPVRVFTPTPNLTAQKAKVAQKKQVLVSITAEEVRKLPYAHPGRIAFMLGGRSGWDFYQQSLQAA